MYVADAEIESYVGQFHFFAVIDTGNGSLALGNDHVVVDVVTKETLFYC